MSEEDMNDTRTPITALIAEERGAMKIEDNIPGIREVVFEDTVVDCLFDDWAAF